MNETHDRIYYVYGFVSTEHFPEICDEINQSSYGMRLFGGGFDENDVRSNETRNFPEEIEGKREWALQGYIDTKLCERAVLANMHKNEAATCALPHLAETFLEELEKREILDVVEKWTSGKCSELFESLMPLAINSSERRWRPRNGSVDGCEMVANRAFLIDEHGIDDSRALAERISKEFSEYGLSFHLSDTWPPYSFCPALDEE